jgi:hypothetical protein
MMINFDDWSEDNLGVFRGRKQDPATSDLIVSIDYTNGEKILVQISIEGGNDFQELKNLFRESFPPDKIYPNSYITQLKQDLDEFILRVQELEAFI